MPVSLPADDDRTLITGSTGSGKTFFGIWLLGTRNWYARPTILFDWKKDKLIAQLPATKISIRSKPPRDPGLYVVQPLPEADEAAVDTFLFKCWQQEDMILYFDEGYMVGKSNKWYNALLTQGRSKLIEIITLSQRPVWLSRFAFSEATYFAIFRLTDADDRKTVGRFVPPELYTSKTRLERFQSVWYDVAQGEGLTLAPVPSRTEIIAMFGNGQRTETTKRKVIL